MNRNIFIDQGIGAVIIARTARDCGVDSSRQKRYFFLGTLEANAFAFRNVLLAESSKGSLGDHTFSE